MEVVAQLPHPELNGFVKRTLESGSPRIDLLSTHTKYAPSQAEWLAPLDGVLPATSRRICCRGLASCRASADGFCNCLGTSTCGYCIIDATCLKTRANRKRSCASRDVRCGCQTTWTELAEVASFFTRPGLYGFLFPGRDSGLFGTFYEMLVGAGGELFDDALRPAFDSSAGIWAAGLIADLHHHRRVTPRDLPAMAL